MIGNRRWRLAALTGVALLAASLFWRYELRKSSPRISNQILTLDTFVLNLAGASDHAYLRVGVAVGYQGVARETALRTSLIRDAVLDELAKAKAEDVLVADGRQELKARVLEALKQRAPEMHATEIYFTELLVQR